MSANPLKEHNGQRSLYCSIYGNKGYTSETMFKISGSTRMFVTLEE